MDVKAQWDAVYTANPPDAFSWFRPHLETSLTLIQRATASPAASIIDIGGGASTLADDLLALGYQHISVLDISEAALEAARKRLVERENRIHWISGDVTSVELPERAYDLWHDRAVFHFLTAKADRAAYAHQAMRSLKQGGHLILATFAANGPEQCSGLETARYTVELLAQEMGEHFHLIESLDELHRTPNGMAQPFIYARFQAV